MAQERTSMRKIREVLRLHFEAQISQAKIAGVAKLNQIYRSAIYHEIYGRWFKLADRFTR